MVLSQQKVKNGFKFNLQIIPPPADNGGFFPDTLNVGIRGKDTLAVNCRGFYPRSLSKSNHLGIKKIATIFGAVIDSQKA